MPVMSPKLPGGAGTLGGQRGLLPPLRPQLVASRCAVPTSSWGNGASSRTDTLSENRKKLFIGPSDVTDLQVAACGYYLKSDATGEHALGNDYSWTAALELGDGSASFKLYANGVAEMNVPDGCPAVLTDPAFGVDFAAGAAFFLRQRMAVASSANDLFPSSSQSATTAESGYVAPSGATVVYGTGAISTVSGGASFGGALPLLVIGRPKTPHCSVIINGDSISVGNNDTVNNTTGAYAFIARGLDNVNGFTIPYQWCGVGGDKLAEDISANEWRKYWSYQFATHVIFEKSTNDIAAGTSLATLQSLAIAEWTRAKRTIGPYGKPLQTMHTKVMPRTTSTDSWATAGNQTPATGFGVGGVRDQFNAWLDTQVGGGLLDAVIDPNPAVEDPNNHGCWITNGSANYGTTDGIHPNNVLHVAAAAYINNWALGITP